MVQLRSRARRQFERGRLVRGREKKGRKEEENKEKYRNREWERNIDARIIPSRYTFITLSHFLLSFNGTSIILVTELIKIIIIHYLYV